MKKILSICLAMASTLCLFAANTKTTVSQVSSAVTVSENVDYIITSDTPFVEGGSINITNTEHAVVILQNIRPSVAISTWLGKYVTINGAKAVNKSNCQVRMYAQGAIIFPYANNIKPLTVYSGQNFTGTSVNSFGLENTGGYMNTLTEEKLNNKIRSFKLKRGYMVTFSTRASGRGYSRCFIADQEDLEFATLPTVLDGTITSYRLFQWYNAPKKGLGSDTRADANALINSSWCYDWGTGHDMLPDVECVPNHIYEDWPSSAACGGVTYSCHLKTNNEPGNASDDHPQDVATVLANWENLMRTGLRLCSESSHDGSMSHLKAFIDSIDARGWRCDILDLHCYWPSGTFNNLTWYSDNYGNGRPIWISEWVWGASWNNNGAFNVSNRDAFEANFANCYNGTKPILDVINANSRVERYAYWNSEANCSKLFNGDMKLSTLGEYYKKMNPGLGYNPANEFIPKNPRQYAPSGLEGKYDNDNQQITLTWSDQNGEYNQWMIIQQKKAGTNSWSTVDTVVCKEDASKYQVTIPASNGSKYRIQIKDLSGNLRNSNEVSAVSGNVSPGDIVSTDDKTLYLGGNMLPNGDFELGLLGWLSGTGENISAPYFQAVPVGGIDGGAYLQCYGGSTDKASAECVRMDIKLEPNSYYYASASGCHNNPSYQRISASALPALEQAPYAVTLQDVDKWATSGAPIRVKNDTVCHIWFRNCAGVAQIDNVFLGKLFETQEEALADALACSRKRAELFQQYCKDATIAGWVAEQATKAQNYTAIEEAIQNALSAMKASINVKDIETAHTLGLCSDEVYQTVVNGGQLPNEVLERKALADETLNALFKYTLTSSNISQPNFATADGWNTKCGTYTGGDQRLATQAGLTCWNAWWNITASGNEQQTMAIRQEISGLVGGLYALECKATTQHLCETDQHAVFTNKTTGQSVVSEALPYGLLDLLFKNADKWCTLVSPYLMVKEGDVVEIGFEGSKAGAVDKSWIEYGKPTSTGDRREGWWCATDFTFRQIPIHFGYTDASQWGAVCLSYAFAAKSNMKIYELAGILSDRSAICLKEVSEIKAGYPYVYHIDNDTVGYFFEDMSTYTKRVKTNINGLCGEVNANAYSVYEIGDIVLRNGVWTRLTEEESLPNYTAFIRKTTSLPVLESWEGISLPTSGCEEIELGELGLNDLSSNVTSPRATYNLAGQRTTSTRGLIVRHNQVIFVKR